jgi:hypothetical protein
MSLPSTAALSQELVIFHLRFKAPTFLEFPCEESVSQSAQPFDVMLSKAKHLAFSNCNENEILRLRLKNDIATQPRGKGEHRRAAIYRSIYPEASLIEMVPIVQAVPNASLIEMVPIVQAVPNVPIVHLLVEAMTIQFEIDNVYPNTIGTPQSQ